MDRGDGHRFIGRVSLAGPGGRHPRARAAAGRRSPASRGVPHDPVPPRRVRRRRGGRRGGGAPADGRRGVPRHPGHRPPRHPRERGVGRRAGARRHHRAKQTRARVAGRGAGPVVDGPGSGRRLDSRRPAPGKRQGSPGRRERAVGHARPRGERGRARPCQRNMPASGLGSSIMIADVAWMGGEFSGVDSDCQPWPLPASWAWRPPLGRRGPAG